MAEACMTLSLMDTDLVEGMVRAIIALHQADAHDDCFTCRDAYPCATVRVIAAFQDASVRRVSNPNPKLDRFNRDLLRETEPENENRRQTHRFLYPECPQFSGGICNEHKDTPLAAGL